jgi:hypothetical protein
METTVEVSCSKWPKYSEMDLFWEENRDSLLSYWEMLISGMGIDGEGRDGWKGGGEEGVEDGGREEKDQNKEGREEEAGYFFLTGC